MCMAHTSPAHACCRDPGLLESIIDRFQLDSAAVADAGMQCTIAGSEDQRIRGAAAVIHDHPTVTFEARVPRETKFGNIADRSEEHTSELQSLMRISYAVFCLHKKKEQQ